MGLGPTDRGDIVLGWLTKIVVVLAVLGVGAFEAVSIGVAHVRTQDIAAETARAGSTEYARTKDVRSAYTAAEAFLQQYDNVLRCPDEGSAATICPDEFVVEQDGTIEVTVHREAGSLLLHRFSATRKWLRVEETARARFVG